MDRPRQRWAIAAGAGVALALLLVLALAHGYARERVVDAGSADLLRRQQLLARGLDQVFARAEQRALELAAQIDRVGPDPAQLVAILEAKLLNDGESVQLGVLVEPDNPIRPGGRFAVGVTYGAGGLHTVDFVRNGYDYWNKPWYVRTLGGDSGWWSDPYFNDAAGGIDTITYDHPLRDAGGRPFGMLSISVALDRVAEIAAELGWQHGDALGDFLLVDAQGRILLAADPAVERAYTLTSAPAREAQPLVLWTAQRPRLAEPLQERHPGGVAASFVQVPIPRVGWRAAATLSDAVLLAPLWRMTWAGIGLALLFGVLAALLVGTAWRRLQRPLHGLALAVERLGEGQFDAPLPALAGSIEQVRLAGAFEHARQSLRGQIGAARAERDAELRREGERALALRLQRAQLPEDRVFFGQAAQAQVCAGLRAAAADGAGFYGFVSVAPGVFVFYLGEVVGAAPAPMLQLGRIATMAGLVARGTASPAAALAAMAEQLAQLDGADVSVELLVGRVDLDRGWLRIAQAGAAAALQLEGERQAPLPVPAAPALHHASPAGWPEWQGRCGPGERLLVIGAALLAGAADAPAEGDLHALQVAAERHAELPARALLDRLLDEAAALPGRGDRDRLALLLELRHRD